MINETYISFETAKLAKEKGFYIPCMYFYEENKIYTYDSYMDWNKLSDGKYIRYNCPTQALLQKWLRENNSIHIELLCDGWASHESNIVNNNLSYRAFIYKVGEPAPRPHDDIGCSNYETILELALQKSLHLIK